MIYWERVSMMLIEGSHTSQICLSTLQDLERSEITGNCLTEYNMDF